ncbi:translation initiation factor IF-3, mitochondrial isoform X2 [Rana temporaria]|nr:translation initiation factor IF-3, mitochondrial isoform X2 [Rana temporaria]
MSLCRIHLKKLVCQAANQGLYSFERHLGFYSQWFKVRSPRPWNPVACVQTGELVAGIRLHCTAEPKAQPIRKKKENPNAKKVIGNVGRLIPYNYIQMISENGEDMGKMSRWKAIKIMEERDLKLVVFREDADPPMYRLMTGKQIFEEQTKLREKQKLSSGPSSVQVKEMSFLASIEKHDLDIKKKQLAQWIEKKYHVRVTVTKRRAADGPGKEDVLQNLLKFLQNQATCSSEPKERKDGRAVVCVLRPLSAKELQKLKKDLEPENRKEQNTPKTKLEQSPNTELTNS